MQGRCSQFGVAAAATAVAAAAAAWVAKTPGAEARSYLSVRVIKPLI
jgi:hypothetical protein